MIRAEVGHNYEASYVPETGGESNQEFIRRHWARPGFCTSMGRAGIGVVCRHLGLRAADDVYITTTFGAHYVSSTVTCTIFNYCRPSKELTDHTRLIYVIHDFGVPHPETARLAQLAKSRGIPLLEDCAYCVESRHPDGRPVGAFADFVIYSLPKVYPIPHGGIVLGQMPAEAYQPTKQERRMLERIEYALARHVPDAAKIGAARRANWEHLRRGLEGAGLSPLFRLPDAVAPYCFPVVAPGGVEETVAAVRRAGYEAFAWRGGDIAVLPVHQELAREDLDRMVAAVQSALTPA